MRRIEKKYDGVVTFRLFVDVEVFGVSSRREGEETAYDMLSDAIEQAGKIKGVVSVLGCSSIDEAVEHDFPDDCPQESYDE